MPVPPDEHTTPSLPVAGWRERVDLPEWGLCRVRAKLDTGARTSAIDVANIDERPDGTVRFCVVGRHAPVRRTKWVEAPIVRRTLIKPSHGIPQQRIVCSTPVRLGEIEAEIEISLVCRRNMLCRMLLGRSALLSRVLIDPAHKYLLTPQSLPTPPTGPDPEEKRT